MRTLIVILLSVLLTNSVNAQLNITASGVLPTAPQPAASIDIGYDLPKFTLRVGATSSFIQNVSVPDYVYLKVGKTVKRFNKSLISINVGVAMKYFDREVWRGTDKRYSHFETITFGRPVLSVSYNYKLFYRTYFVGEITQIGAATLFSVGATFKIE